MWNKLEFNEPKEHVIARRAKPDVAISKGFHLNFVGFSPCSEGIATPVCALARNDSVYIQLAKLKFDPIPRSMQKGRAEARPFS